ncbi:MAG: Sir2 silent information regulator family NAD-dependent deacetylase [Muribaculaceae bacterium]|nr:Sir2 silent information regulator family NAD-dependent deacetylase [Muribaculaceae bacterium]
MSEKPLNERIDNAIDKIKTADAILIGAGAGLSSAAGIDYSGPEFRNEFADYIQKYGFRDLYSSGFYDFPTEEERWTRWARHIRFTLLSRDAMPLYKSLLQLVDGKDFFVITTNVDEQFRKAGFPIDRLFEVQGDYGKMQCSVACHDKTYDDTEVVNAINAHAHDMTVDSRYVPVCPVCGKSMDVNLRVNQYFVEDENWHKAANLYEKFITSHINSRLVLLEIGVGMNTPSIIRYPFEHITYSDKKATLIRMNDSWPLGVKENADRTISFAEDISQIIPKMVDGLTHQHFT